MFGLQREYLLSSRLADETEALVNSVVEKHVDLHETGLHDVHSSQSRTFCLVVTATKFMVLLFL